jgi:cytochrome c oxidase assembly protein subunit 11
MSMSVSQDQIDVNRRRANRRVAIACGGFFAGMIGMAYAAVPLYELFCQVTGYGGTTQRVEQYSQTVLDRDITIRFDSNVRAALGWEFEPAQRDVTIKIGETTQINYLARNTISRPTTGTATFNVSPDMAGAYFMKMECFCFTETELQPGEEMEMPVVFYVDPEIVNSRELENIKTITLSYTFHPSVNDAGPVAARGAKVEADGETGG